MSDECGSLNVRILELVSSVACGVPDLSLHNPKIEPHLENYKIGEGINRNKLPI